MYRHQSEEAEHNRNITNYWCFILHIFIFLLYEYSRHNTNFLNAFITYVYAV